MPDTKNIRCRHIFHDGHSCGSPALRNEEFCYYHHNTRKPRKGPPLADASSAFELPIPEDRSAIQASIAIIVQRVAAGSLDGRRASILLRALKLAQQTMTFIGPPKSLNPVTEMPVAEVETEHDKQYVEPYKHEFNPELERSLWSPDPVAAYLSNVQAAEEHVHTPLIAPLPHAMAGSTNRSNTKKAPLPFGVGLSDLCRRSPNLPHTYACSTIGPTRLNFRVRDGNGCDPRGKLTGKPENSPLAIFHN